MSRGSGEDELRSGEKRKTSGYLGIESHFHSNLRSGPFLASPICSLMSSLA